MGDKKSGRPTSNICAPSWVQSPLARQGLLNRQTEEMAQFSIHSIARCLSLAPDWLPAVSSHTTRAGRLVSSAIATGNGLEQHHVDAFTREPRSWPTWRSLGPSSLYWRNLVRDALVESFIPITGKKLGDLGGPVLSEPVSIHVGARVGSCGPHPVLSNGGGNTPICLGLPLHQIGRAHV